MRKLFFEDSLKLELNVIGYHDQGESIVFFIKTDGIAAYTGLMDCYKTEDQNAVKMVLEKEQVEKIDFVCWTHPHDDHTQGLGEIWKQYCTKDTCFCCTDIIQADLDLYSEEAKLLFQNIRGIHTSSKRKKMRIMYLKDSTQAERLLCVGNTKKYEFRIQSFAPNSAILGERFIGSRDQQGNAYSVGLFLFLGQYSIMLAGDVENQTIRRIADGDIEYPVDYIKIPHHGSKSASFLPDKMRGLNLLAPDIAATTLFRIHSLPEEQVLAKYDNWGCGEIYLTGNMEKGKDTVGYGIVKTTFDILEQNEYDIETELIGDAVVHQKEMAG